MDAAKSNDDSAGSDSLDKSMQMKCVMVEGPSNSSPSSGSSNCSPSPEELDACSRDSSTEAASSQQTGQQGAASKADQKTEAGAGDSSASSASSAGSASPSPSASASACATASASPSPPCTAFETKVKLISQNLKETTLESSASSASGPNHSPSPTDCDTASAGSRVKKVRFHPDAKENDGSNWAKKKRRSAQARRPGSPSGMELDGELEHRAGHGGKEAAEECDGEDEDATEGAIQGAEEEEEPEEEFDLAKTLAEATDYLKQHPLTFVNRVEQNGEREDEDLDDGDEGQDQDHDHDQQQGQEGEDEDGPLPSRLEANDEDFYKRLQPENGIERILGKETKAGKVQYLLRLEKGGGLFWEPEDFTRQMCPALLKAYEKNRERRQQRLMHHVAKRQSMRQRYTDF